VYIPDLLYTGEVFNDKSMRIVKGFAEPALKQIKDGEIVQFERFGFVRIEQTDKGIIANFCHR